MGTTNRFDARPKSSSSGIPPRRFMVLGILAWIGFSLDTLESFSPTSSRCTVPTERSKTSLLSSTIERKAKEDAPAETDATEDVTVTLPSFADEDSVPSPLHHIHVRSLFSDDEVGKALNLALEFAEATKRFESPDSDRHVSYATCDFPVDECPPLESFLESLGFEERLFGQLGDLYSMDADDLSFNDLFVAYYQAKPDGDDTESDNNYINNDDIMDRLELHRDGSLLSFSLLLNPPDEFEGGGTFYDALRDTDPHGILHAGGAIRPSRPGDAVLHCGKILHGADVVKAGRRVVLVGFVDVSDRCVRKGSLGAACKEWGRQDVARYRFQKQEKKQHKGWVLNNARWLSGASALNGFVPASSGVVRRADPEACRLRRLKTEDTLLRNILLLPEERGPKGDALVPFSLEGFEDISFLPEIGAE